MQDTLWGELKHLINYHSVLGRKFVTFGLEPYIHADDKDADYVTCDNQYGWYCAYAAIKKPKAILEIGVRRGYSIISMCLGHLPHDVCLIDSGIDGFEPYDVSVQLGELGVANCLAYLSPSSQMIDRLPYSWEYDLIHIDGEHTPDALKSDLRYSRFLAPDGWIIVDDVGDMPELLETCKEFAQNGWDLLEVPTFRGHAVMRRTPDVDRCVMNGGKG